MNIIARRLVASIDRHTSEAFLRAIPMYLMNGILSIGSIIAIVVLWSSYAQSFPVASADVVVFVQNSGKEVRLTEVRKYVGTESSVIHVQRTFYEKSNPNNYFLVENAGHFGGLVGEFPVVFEVAMPKWVTGQWCVRTTLRWSPAWSARSYFNKPKDVCFETTEYE